MTHTPNVAHCIPVITELSLQFLLFIVLFIFRTHPFWEYYVLLINLLSVKNMLINQKRWNLAQQSSHNCSISVSYLCDRKAPGVCPSVSHHRQFTTEARFSRVQRYVLVFICEHLQSCTFRKLSFVFIFSATRHRHTVQKKMRKRKAENVSKCEFNEQLENELLFFAGPSGKPRCALCVKTVFHRIEHMILTDIVDFGYKR